MTRPRLEEHDVSRSVLYAEQIEGVPNLSAWYCCRFRQVVKSAHLGYLADITLLQLLYMWRMKFNGSGVAAFVSSCTAFVSSCIAFVSSCTAFVLVLYGSVRRL